MSARPALRRIGYWAPEAAPEEGLGGAIGAFLSQVLEPLPRASEAVDRTWAPAERQAVLAYLAQGRVFERWFGQHACRLCGAACGSCCMTDGAYVWPEGYSHYLDKHGVRPPADFVAHVRSAGAFGR